MATVTLGKVSINPRGNYSSTTSYAILDLVSYRGGSYLCTTANKGILPGVTSGWASYWLSLTKGITSLTITSPATGKATIAVTFSDGTSTSTTIDTSAPGAGSIGNEELAVNAVGTTNVQNSSITRVKLSPDALYSPNRRIGTSNTNYSPSADDLGMTYITVGNGVSYNFNFTEEVSAQFSAGAELAVAFCWGNGVNINCVGNNVVFITMGGSGQMRDTTLAITERYGMAALKLVNIQAGVYYWLVTGNVEVVE